MRSRSDQEKGATDAPQPDEQPAKKGGGALSPSETDFVEDAPDGMDPGTLDSRG
jgi:hypothetical protein